MLHARCNMNHTSSHSTPGTRTPSVQLAPRGDVKCLSLAALTRFGSKPTKPQLGSKQAPTKPCQNNQGNLRPWRPNLTGDQADLKWGRIEQVCYAPMSLPLLFPSDSLSLEEFVESSNSSEATKAAALPSSVGKDSLVVDSHRIDMNGSKKKTQS